MQPTPLILIGAGGFGREAAEATRAINAAAVQQAGTPLWELLGFLDDGLQPGTPVAATAVLGPIKQLADFGAAQLVVCTGNPRDFDSKRRIVAQLDLPPTRYATLIHPDAALAASCSIGAGSVVLAGVVATADVQVGAHAGLMPHVVLTHDDQLADFVTIGAGARLAGNVRVGAGAYLGSGCLVREQCEIGAGALIGMGAVVTRDVPAGEVWAGVPARRLATI